MKVTFDTKGIDEIIQKLDEKFSERRVTTVVNKALNQAAEEYKEGLEEAQAPYASTGGQVASTHAKRARKKRGMHNVDVGWKVGAGEHGSLAHLNEYGYTRWGKTYSPAGTGLIRAYIDGAEEKYKENVKQGLMELLE